MHDNDKLEIHGILYLWKELKLMKLERHHGELQPSVQCFRSQTESEVHNVYRITL